MRKTLALLALACACAFGQTNDKGQIVNITTVPRDGLSSFNEYDGSGNLIYRCSAKSVQTSFSWRRSNTSLTSIAVSSGTGTVTTSTAHGLQVGNSVTVAGSIVGNLNAAYKVATVGSTTTFTIATSGVPDATYNNADLTVSTTAPRTSAAQWSIRKYTYSGTNLITEQWATTSLSSSDMVTMTSVCTDRATLSYN